MTQFNTTFSLSTPVASSPLVNTEPILVTPEQTTSYEDENYGTPSNWFGDPSSWTYDGDYNGPTYNPTDPIWNQRYQYMKNKGYKGTFEQFMEGVKSYGSQLATQYNNTYNNAQNTTKRNLASGYNPNFQGSTSDASPANSASGSFDSYDPNLGFKNTMDTLTQIGNVVHPAVGSLISLMGTAANIKKTNAEADFIKDSSPARLEALKLSNKGASLSNTGASIENDYRSNLNPLKLQELGLDVDFIKDSYNKRLKFLDEKNIAALLDNNSKLFSQFGWDKPDAFSSYFSPSKSSPDAFDYIIKQGNISLQHLAKAKADEIVKGIKLNNQSAQIRKDLLGLNKEQKEAFNDYYKNTLIPSMSSKNKYNAHFYDTLYDKVPDIVKNQVNKGTIENLYKATQTAQNLYGLYYGNPGAMGYNQADIWFGLGPFASPYQEGINNLFQ